MKLSELQTKYPVRDGGSGSSRTYFRDGDGWDLTLEQGVVTMRKGDIQRILPFGGNVAWAAPMSKEEVEAKKEAEAKKGKAA